MSRLVDLHSHVLPGVDDGPATVDEAVALLRAAHEAGVRVQVATPHMFSPMFRSHSSAEIRQAFADLIEALRFVSRHDPALAFLAELELLLGAENFCSPEFVAALDQGDVLTLNDGRYLLLEFGPHLPIDSIDAVVQRVLRSGRFPLLAHVERYPVFHGKGMRRLAALVEMGCVAQVNADSVLGPRFSRLRRGVMRLLESGLVTLIASDAHDALERPPRQDRAWAVLAGRFGEARARAWMVSNPRAVLGV